MLADIVNANRFKRAVADVKRYLCQRCALSDLRENFWSEMQTRCRRRYRTALF